MITLRLDKNGGINKGDVVFYESDNISEKYVIQLYKNGAIYDLTNKTVELTIVEKKRKYGNIFNLPIENATEGKFRLLVTSDISKECGLYDFKVTVKDDTGLVETFPSFQVEVLHDLTRSIASEIVNSDDFEILTEGLKALSDYNIYKTNALKVPALIEQLDTINTEIEALEKEVDIGCVLRPTSDLSNPWILFQDDAHESKGVASISHNSDGTIQVTFDKTYKKIKAFNAFNDEMMKIYGLEVGASTGLNTAKLFLVSKLQVGISLTFNQSTGDITINSGGGYIESVKWTSGVGVVIKFKNVPMQTPKSVQVTVTNALFLHSTCSITGNREITVKFYKPTGELVADITGNWSCMINANFTGLVNFNATSTYDESILSSMALMYSATMKQ